MSDQPDTTPDPGEDKPDTTPDAPKADPPESTGTPDETDWKAKSREWEKRAKANSKAAEELEKYRMASMTEQEKAVADAEARGRTAAVTELGRELAQAKFEAAAAAKGIDLGDAADLIDTAKFLDDKGQVDTEAIKTAVAKLAKLAPKPATQRSSSDKGGGSGEGAKRPTSLNAAVSQAYGR
ncbi:hypothetical protein M8C13_04510 [Crossiella sp. SN42]|uniref:hypothetical protein n=1 Tax=Crossiella sp. SN42 TaxID=2944808 RepID=UPI00207CE7AC|nr:hypothetical protein [Crossiella sp. SN42]MCO1575021.1 hypothetical protein [Crossiella sp. SN42]